MPSGSEVASVYVRIGADLSGLSNGLAQASGAVETMSGAFSALKASAIGFVAAQAVREVGDFFKQLASDAYAAVAAQEKLGMSAASLAASEAMAADPTLTLAEAMFTTGDRAQELLTFINQLALASPFSTEMIGQSVRQAMLYGVQSEQAMGLTQALVDYAAAAGLSNDEMGRLGVAFGQMAGKGKLMGEEMRQFTNAGFGVANIAQIMGMEVSEVASAMKEGEISAQALIDGFIKWSGTRFGGKAEDMAGSFAGMAETLKDVKDLGLRKVFGEFDASTGKTSGLMGALQPVLQEFMQTMTDPAFLAALTRLGEVFSATFADTIDGLSKTLPQVVTALSGLAPALLAISGPTIGTAVGHLTNLAGTAAGLGALATNLGTLVSLVVDPMGKVGDKFGGFVDALGWIATAGNPALLFFRLMADQLDRINKSFGPVIELVAKWRGVDLSGTPPVDNTVEAIRRNRAGRDNEIPPDALVGVPVEPAVTTEDRVSWFDKILQGLGLQEAPLPIPTALNLDVLALEAQGEMMGAAARRGYDRGFGSVGTSNQDVIQELRARGAW